jgi:hypothetical protein
MSTSELHWFPAILAVGAAEVERPIRQREGIALERSADQLDELQWASERAIAVSNLDREFGQLRSARATLRRVWCQELLDREPEEMQALTLDQFANAA